MTRYYIIVKRKNSKRYLGAIPARRGISISALRKSAKEQIRKGFSYRIVTESQLKKILPRLLKKPKRMTVMVKKGYRKKTRKKKPRKKAKRKIKRKRR